MYSFSYMEPVCCSMSSSNCCFLTCIHISQEAGQKVWYSRLFQNFPQFVVIHTIKGLYKLDLEKAEEPEIRLPTSVGSSKKQESSRKTSISALLTTPKPLIVWITINLENSEKHRNTRQPDLPLEKPVCRSESNS